MWQINGVAAAFEKHVGAHVIVSSIAHIIGFHAVFTLIDLHFHRFSRQSISQCCCVPIGPQALSSPPEQMVRNSTSIRSFRALNWPSLAIQSRSYAPTTPFARTYRPRRLRVILAVSSTAKLWMAGFMVPCHAAE
jgi:hypothetical protein